MARETAKERLERAYQDGVTVGRSQQKQQMEAEYARLLRNEELKQVQATTALLDVIGRLASRAGYLVKASKEKR